MTDIYVYCPICNKEDGKGTLCDKVMILLGSPAYKLSCGHIVDKDGFVNMHLEFWFNNL